MFVVVVDLQVIAHGVWACEAAQEKKLQQATVADTTENPPEEGGPPQAGPASPKLSFKTFTDTNNSDYYALLQTMLQVIDDHPKLHALADRDPLQITSEVGQDSGVQAAFDAEDCRTALQREQVYRCAGNLFWQNFFLSSTPKVPLSMKRLQAWKHQIFGTPPTPTHFHDRMAVFAVDSADFDMSSHKGRLMRLSPEEISHAVVAALAESVKAGATDGEIDMWLKVVLSTPCVFEIVGGGDGAAHYWRAFELRQGIAGDNDLTKRTARQWCIEVAGTTRQLVHTDTHTHTHTHTRNHVQTHMHT